MLSSGFRALFCSLGQVIHYINTRIIKLVFNFFYFLCKNWQNRAPSVGKKSRRRKRIFFSTPLHDRTSMKVQKRALVTSLTKKINLENPCRQLNNLYGGMATAKKRFLSPASHLREFTLCKETVYMLKYIISVTGCAVSVSAWGGGEQPKYQIFVCVLD